MKLFRQVSNWDGTAHEMNQIIMRLVSIINLKKIKYKKQKIAIIFICSKTELVDKEWIV